MNLPRESGLRAAGMQTNRYVPILFDAGYVLIGLTCLSLGVAICVSTPWGTQPWDVLHLGVARLTGLSLGRVSQFVGILVVLLTLAMRGKGVTWLTVVNVTVIGFQVDSFLPHTPYVSGWLGLIYLELGVVLLGLGMALYLTPAWGAGPRDSLMLVLHQRTGKPIGRIRITLDVGVVALGWLLGGPVGLGTLLAAVTTGLWAQLFLRHAASLRQRYLHIRA